MDRLIRILRAAHCRSTHHFFVIDAIPLVRTEAGRRLASQFLRHHSLYLRGAKAPDKEFRDFRNHVLHVSDNHWGGAPKLATEWYLRCLDKIRLGDMPQAAFAAGVMSHYVTDPLMPLHTAQSERESIAHRAMEWSVTKSYQRILNRYRQGDLRIVFDLTDHDDWLGDAVTKGAQLAHQHYDFLLDRYDLAQGSCSPQEGLDDESIDRLAGLFGVAITGWARIIERLADHVERPVPLAPLSLTSLMATIKMPAAWVIRRFESASEQRAVRAIFDEYESTGKVVEHLPSEVATVRRERAHDLEEDASQPNKMASPEPIRPAVSPEVSENSVTAIRRRSSLALSDDLVEAPSIGPKTAKRFAAIGVTTVDQFLAAPADALATQLATRWIHTETVRDWQDQARLVVDVPALCGYKAKLLVGVDCRDSQSLASRSAASLHQQIGGFARTGAGKRALRGSRIPSRDEVARWIRSSSESAPRRRSA